MLQIITDTAELSCNQGTATNCLNVTSQDFVTIEGKAMATEEDKQANSNIQPFKQCKLKPSSGGYLPCVPAPIQWEDAARIDTIMGFYRNNDFNTAFRPESTAVIESFKNEYRNVTIDRNGTSYRYFVPKLMRKILLYIVVLTINHMMAQENKNSLKDTIMFKRFDFELYKRNYEGYKEDPTRPPFYILADGSAFESFVGGDDIYYLVIPPKPSYHYYMYFYYPNGRLKEYGAFAGLRSTVKIGVWRQYDAIGDETQVDEEAKFEKWSFNKVLEVLEKDGVINLRTGKHREANELDFDFCEKEKKCTVAVVKEVIDVFIDVYYEYIFDCVAGTYTREEYERYNNKAIDLSGLPQLKNSKENKDRAIKK